MKKYTVPDRLCTTKRIGVFKLLNNPTQYSIPDTTATLYACDCRELLPTLPAASVDLILIDPPYNISRSSGFVNNSDDRPEYIAKYGKHQIDFGAWDKEDSVDMQFMLEQVYRVLKPHGTFLCFYDFWKLYLLRETAENVGFKQPRLGCWNKTNPVPINSKLNYLTNAKEFFVTFVKGGKPTFNSVYDNAEYFYTADTCDTYSHAIVHGKERLAHPTQKPLALIEALVQKHSNPGDTVLDFFAGTGTTGVACMNTKRNSVLCERTQQYIPMITARLSDCCNKCAEVH